MLRAKKKKMILSVIFSVLSVMLGLAPFYCMYRLISLFVAGTVTKAAIGNWCLVALAVYLGKILLFHPLHRRLPQPWPTPILEGLRLRLADRFLHAPLGRCGGPHASARSRT